MSVIDSAKLVKQLQGRIRSNNRRLSRLDLDGEWSDDTSEATKLLATNDALQEIINLVERPPERLRPKKKDHAADW